MTGNLARTVCVCGEGAGEVKGHGLFRDTCTSMSNSEVLALFEGGRWRGDVR